jgi:hypothetical protein
MSDTKNNLNVPIILLLVGVILMFLFFLVNSDKSFESTPTQCYQTQPNNNTNGCGLSTGYYNFSGNGIVSYYYSSNSPVNNSAYNCLDNSQLTICKLNKTDTTSNMTINYSIPTGYITTAVWYVNRSNGSVTSEVALPLDNCSTINDTYSLRISFFTDNNSTATLTYINASCYNGSSDYMLLNSLRGYTSAGNLYGLYDERVYWTIYDEFGTKVSDTISYSFINIGIFIAIIFGLGYSLYTYYRKK